MIKRLIKTIIDNEKRVIQQIESTSEFVGTEFEWEHDAGNKHKVGIIFDHFRQHDYYLKACIELNIDYKVFDLRSNNWQNEISESNIQKFLVWPSIFLGEQKFFWDTRLYALKNYLKKSIFPSEFLLWAYESKIRSQDWLVANNLNIPKTYISFNKEEALDHIKSHSSFPLVLKTDQGAAASGVYIVKTKKEALKYVRKAFKWGIGMKNQPMYLRHRGYVIFQEYLEDVQEWRIIKVGNDYFCRKKVKIGEFHSGSGSIEWATPPTELLNKTKDIAEENCFESVNIDYFETSSGDYLINEIHALWGGKELEKKDLEGKYTFNKEKQEWIFEKGDFFKNRCANLRLQQFLSI